MKMTLLQMLFNVFTKYSDSSETVKFGVAIKL